MAASILSHNVPLVFLLRHMSSYRFVAFGIMIVTCAVSLGIAGPMDNEPVWGFKLSGFAVAFTSLGISQTMHYKCA